MPAEASRHRCVGQDSMGPSFHYWQFAHPGILEGSVRHGAALPPRSAAHLARSCGGLLLLCCSRGGALHASMTSEACEGTRVGGLQAAGQENTHGQGPRRVAPHLSSRWAWQQDDLGLRQARLLVVVGSDVLVPATSSSGGSLRGRAENCGRQRLNSHPPLVGGQ